MIKKLEVLVLDGDFSHGDEGWSSDEFSGAIVREREGRRPLLVGTLNVAMADDHLGVAFIDDVAFTDNSSWTRSRRFRIGVRAVAVAGSGDGGGLRIREAVSESFMVKDHRGECGYQSYSEFVFVLAMLLLLLLMTMMMSVSSEFDEL